MKSKSNLKDREKVLCEFCKQRQAIQCMHKQCKFAFHPICAFSNWLTTYPDIMRYFFSVPNDHR